jgi:hypothetical protein
MIQKLVVFSVCFTKVSLLCGSLLFALKGILWNGIIKLSCTENVQVVELIKKFHFALLNLPIWNLTG